jgi:two-component system phosphate regulon sensor histidine kinase PhoR
MPEGAFSRINRIALKLGAAVAAGTLVLVLVLRALPLTDGWETLLLALGVGGLTLYVGQRVLAGRLDRARATLQQIRRHQFEDLDTARLQRDDELDALIWEVYRTGQALEKEIRELKRLENYRREFLGDVSHELKTPIFAIHGFAETLLEGALEDRKHRRRFVEKILRNASRLNNLAIDLTEISRIETGELKMTAEPFSLLVLVEEVIESLEPAAATKGVILRHQVPHDLPPVQGDRERIRQVLINLSDNAIKYNNPGGHVELVARLLPSGAVKVSVVDDGIGVAPEHIPRLTERFYRVDKSRSRVQGGTGLGLAIVKHILGAHQQQLVVESSPGRGSTFGFTLPTVAAPVEAEVVMS